MRKTPPPRPFLVENPRLLSQVLAFVLLYLDYCYIVLPNTSMFMSSLLSVSAFLLVIAIHNTLTMDPGKIPVNWSKFIEGQLSKAIENEENYLKSVETSRVSVMELNGQELDKRDKHYESCDISRFVEPDSQEEDLYMRAFTNIMRENKEKYRYCDKCEMFKPEPARHCYLCKRCVLGLDHHDKILDKCIGVDNKKYFMLALFYSTMSYLLFFLGFWEDGLLGVSDENLIKFAGFCLGTVMSLALFIVYCLILGFFLLLEAWGVGMRDYYKGKRSARRRRFSLRVWDWMLPFREKRLRSEEWFEYELRKKPWDSAKI